ncbi:MAG: methionyl-tRNA formyltransferase [Clostridiales bacterium]|jgi:methionyl-tRNA formyltransferase|nr:methionyl-tRNA formyltransferase [Clostridiales bacterium]
MGTPAFAAAVLEPLCQAHTVAAAVTQPDKAVGRGHNVQPSPVKALALARGIPVFQPKRLRHPENVESLRQWKADVIVVAAYGQILPADVLIMPRYGCVNVHASLLPKYRGAAPIRWAIIHGEAETGVTIMQMDEGMDTGGMLLKQAVPIGPDDDYAALHDRLAAIGARALLTVLEQIESGTARPEKQNNAEATNAPRITTETGKIDWRKPPVDIVNLIRGLCPLPGAHTFYDGEWIKIRRARAEEAPPHTSGRLQTVFQPGEIIEGDKQGLLVRAGPAGGCVRILEMQAKGGRKMPAADYLRGHPMRMGALLGL